MAPAVLFALGRSKSGISNAWMNPLRSRFSLFLRNDAINGWSPTPEGSNMRGHHLAIFFSLALGMSHAAWGADCAEPELCFDILFGTGYKNPTNTTSGDGLTVPQDQIMVLNPPSAIGPGGIFTICVIVGNEPKKDSARRFLVHSDQCGDQWKYTPAQLTWQDKALPCGGKLLNSDPCPEK
jgi:hypothetical protein